MLMKAPAGMVPGTTVFLLNGSSVVVDANGFIDVPNASHEGPEQAGFAFGYDESARPGFVAGRFYGPPGETLTTNFLTVASTLYAHPFYVPTKITVTSFNANVTTGQAGGKMRGGIYAARYGVMGSLIADCGEVTGLTGAGAATIGSLSIALNAGWYFLAAVFGATSTMPSVAGISQALSSKINQFLGAASVANALAVATTNLATGLNGSFTYGALPIVLPTMSLTTGSATPAFCLGV